MFKTLFSVLLFLASWSAIANASEIPQLRLVIRASTNGISSQTGLTDEQANMARHFLKLDRHDKSIYLSQFDIKTVIYPARVKTGRLANVGCLDNSNGEAVTKLIEARKRFIWLMENIAFSKPLNKSHLRQTVLFEVGSCDSTNAMLVIESKPNTAY